MNALHVAPCSPSEPSVPIVSDMHLATIGDLKPSSYDIYMGLQAPQRPANIWLDVRIDPSQPASKETQEADAVRIALEKLAEKGIILKPKDCEVLHGRDFHYDPGRPYEAAKSDIFLVLAGSHHLVSLHTGESTGIQGAQQKMTTEGFDQHPLNIARLILERSLDPLSQIEVEFDRHVSPLLRKVSHELLTDNEYENLTSIYVAVEHIRRRVSMMKSGVARSASLSLSEVGSKTQASLGPGLDSLIELFNSHEDTCKQISEAIEWTWERHSNLLKKRAIEEQEKTNRIQAQAEERKERSDARWQVLGGVSVPLGLGLALIQSFHLSGGVGIGIMAASTLISAALVYFRNDDFSWLNPSRTDRWSQIMKDVRGTFGQGAW